MRHYLSLPFICSIFMLCACAPLFKQQPPAPPNRAVQAERLLHTGNPVQAAELYQQLAAHKSSSQDLYRLLAAESFLSAGNSNDAQNYINKINPAELTARQRNRLHLIKAQINLSFGEAEQALAQLRQVSVQQLKKTDKKIYYQSLAFAYSLSGDLLKSAQQRITLSRYIDKPRRLHDNYTAILETLTLLSDDTLQTLQPPPPDILGGWMALARIINSKTQYPENFERAIAEWRQSFPRHPANSGFLTTYFAQSQPVFKTPQNIAVLLPDSGPYASASQAIRAGIEAAFNLDKQNPKPQLRYYDSASADPADLYRQAVNNGADLIIGPLNKDNISRLAETTAITIPVLALNHIPGLAKNNLYQFGLSPIDEAEQVADKAMSDGHKKVLILVANDELGQRLAQYYSDSWRNVNGTILEVRHFNAKSNDFSTPIMQLLNLDESESRYRQLRRLLPGVQFVPRRRHDADAIFISGAPDTVRLLNPQLHFYRAKNLPVYGTSQLYDSRPNPDKDIDLNGITFCDMPWLFDHSYLDELSLSALEQSGLRVPNAYLKLVALGIDAYNLSSRLNSLTDTPYAAATGNLIMSADYRVKRKLQCARFEQGYPQPQGLVSHTSPQFDPADSSDVPANNPFHAQ